ncbi:hypothetical protein [uncultured Psychroserpens sp.]|uniref:hypothetical protein n=1 Tax=uncultured Psychroserpens sp. TaxID=255436 RepID=UPI00260E3789|nr:hypothetical protein [uncultured Psychroserpens sp.]
MKHLKPLLLLPILLIFVLLIEGKKQKLETGDIAFSSFHSKHNDSFSIFTLEDIPAHTKIYFTDSEWNGNRFGIDEGNLVWNSGSQSILSHTEIEFSDINNTPKTNIGLVHGSLNLNHKEDAIFAYSGESIKQPTVFIAAVSNHAKSYGTLINTNLKEGQTAITYPKNTFSAIYIGDLKDVEKVDVLKSLNDFDNYKLNQFSDGLAKK